MTTRNLLFTLCTLSLTACLTAPAPKTTGMEAPPAAIPTSLLWYLTAAEKRALFEQIYAQATERVLAHAAAMPAGSWGVIMDVDETLLDNTRYHLSQARSGRAFADDTWEAFVRERRSTALPGSRRFVQRVIDAGGRVFAVTNRTVEICEDTRANLRSEGFQVAAVLCMPKDPATGKRVSDKNPRFEAVRLGNAEPERGPVNVVAWVGDNIKDFPNRTQKNIEPLSEFGDRLFILPNPMYGSWETNTVP